MKILAQLVCVLVVGVGLVGMVMPEVLLDAGRSLATVSGLYFAAVLRVCVGLIFVGASGVSRAPRTLRVIGWLVVVAGLVTPFFGVDRARAIIEWGSGEGAAVVRLVAAVLVAIGLSVAYLVSGGRRATTSR